MDTPVSQGDRFIYASWAFKKLEFAEPRWLVPQGSLFSQMDGFTPVKGEAIMR